MKKKNVLFAFFVFIAFAVYAQNSLKEAVCLIVVGQIHSMKGGSGFLISDGEGNQYIVTNDHVTEKSGTISAIFWDEDGTMKHFENMSVLATDPLYDLAVLGFPMGRKINRQGLKIDINTINNGTECSAAGFPDMKWSFSDGVLLDNNISAYRSGTVQPFIAHSAVIDFGSSGGPLLRRQQNLSAGWAVIGVNTLKAKNGPYFAIPSKRVVGLLNTAVERKTDGRISFWENDRQEKAVQIQLEDPVSASVDASNHVGWYHFSPVSGGDIELTLQSTESFHIELYDTGGKMLDSSRGINPSINAHVSSDDLYLKVSGDNLLYWTTYSVSTSLKAFPDGYDHSSASSPISLEDGKWYTRILHRNDEDWFSVQALPDKALILETDGLNDSRFEVFDLAGTLLAEDENRGTVTDSRSSWIYIPDKTAASLLIRITGYNKPMEEYRFRTIHASQTSGNSTMENAATISPPVPVIGSIKNALEKNWFSVSGPVGTNLNITVEGGDFSLELYDSMHNLLAKDDFTNHLSISMPDGNVFLCIKSAGSKIGPNRNFVIFTETT